MCRFAIDLFDCGCVYPTPVDLCDKAKEQGLPMCLEGEPEFPKGGQWKVAGSCSGCSNLHLRHGCTIMHYSRTWDEVVPIARAAVFKMRENIMAGRDYGDGGLRHLTGCGV
jgi:hypothetical protein